MSLSTRVTIDTPYPSSGNEVGEARDTRVERPDKKIGRRRENLGGLPVARASIAAAAGGVSRADADRPGPVAPAADGPASRGRQRPAAALRRRPPPAASDSAE